MSAPSAVEDVFLAALEKGTPEERAAYLNAACQDDLDLRRRVERLLDAHPGAKQFLEVRTIPPRQGTAAYVPIGEEVGAVIAGRYKLVEKIGEGGMGTVWVAQQTSPVKRVVAVKLIKTGMDSGAVLARFEAERQALALMDHPNIARVLDGGAMPDGRPYFVMELVKGVPITEFCDARKLTPRQRLELFVPVCHAIQHAHQKGVIHRDIKPSNVLIALYDDKPVPKVIDFGVAKATGQTLTDKSLMTGFGAVVGTPEYMSPEQASLNNLDIDTRSDVYSLGVLLYELLAGNPPFRNDELQKAGLIEMLRMVCEDEPPRPSIKLSTANKRASISADRGTEPKKLTGLLRNELDWIVMKALEKDRARRYETVNGFAADVQRYLVGEAVQAHPPSAAYRLRKFVRKHGVGLATAASFLGLLVLAAGLSIWLAVKARQAEALAEKRREEADVNAKDAKKNAELYHKEAVVNIAALREAEIWSQYLQVDLDLSEMRTDPRVGLLRLARPFKQNLANKIAVTDAETGEPIVVDYIEMDNERGDYKALRQFTTLAVLAAGQQFAPLLPPITPDGREVFRTSLSPDKHTLLTFGRDFTARLWDARTAKEIAVLRQGDEKVVNGGFSLDGRTVFTDDQASVARFWDVPSGKFRAATEGRPNRYVIPDEWKITGIPQPSGISHSPSQIGEGRLLTQRFVTKESDLMGGSLEQLWEGPVELWDTTTARLVAHLEAPNTKIGGCRFLGKRWVTSVQDNTLLVFSAADGRLLTRLVHPAGETIQQEDGSPRDRWLATLSVKRSDNSASLWGSLKLRVWDVQSGQVQAFNAVPFNLNPFKFRYWMDDAFDSEESVVACGDHGGSYVFRVGRNEPIAVLPGASPWLNSLGRAGDFAHGGNGWIFDTRTWRRLLPPPGRRFHPDLNKFAVDGRFVRAAIQQQEVVIDTRTDKAAPTNVAWNNLPGFGMIGVTTSGERTTVQLLPSDTWLHFPPDLLELWAQVAVRGHLDEQGAFVPWDEPTWEKKRQELAAKPAPIPDFPFPGHVATDKLHWLRQEYANAKDGAKPALAARLLTGAEAAGDKAEAARWRAVVDADAKRSPQN